MSNVPYIPGYISQCTRAWRFQSGLGILRESSHAALFAPFGGICYFCCIEIQMIAKRTYVDKYIYLPTSASCRLRSSTVYGLWYT